MTHITDNRALVIGGTSGIGRAVADALRARPCQVTVASRSTGLDISDEAAVAAYFAELGPVDHVVVTAGSAAPGGALRDIDIADAKTAFETKFWGVINVAKYAAKSIRPGGSITLTSGFLSRRTVPGTYVKTAMNAGLEAVAKVLAKEFAPIRVNVVSPGLTETEAYAGMEAAARAAMYANAARNLPVGRVGKPNDLAQGYLLAIDNPFMTGAVIDVDGGALIK